MDYSTKDSGKHEQYPSGMRRDTEDNKPNFSLLMPLGVPFSEQMLTRWAQLMTRGKDKYGARNWEKAHSQEELQRAQSSAFRHFIQYLSGETDEDHAAAVLFNLSAAETIRWKRQQEAD